MPSLAAPGKDFRPLTKREFDQISQLAYDKFGLELKGEKLGLVSARLGKKARAAGCRSFQEYYERVIGDSPGDSLIELIAPLPTNFPSFMREPPHFEFLCKQVLPEWAARDRVRIWSGPFSRGEEPYPTAFTLLDVLGGSSRPRLQIVE